MCLAIGWRAVVIPGHAPVVLRLVAFPWPAITALTAALNGVDGVDGIVRSTRDSGPRLPTCAGCGGGRSQSFGDNNVAGVWALVNVEVRRRAAETPLRFAVTLADLERVALYRSRWTSRSISADDRYEVAWSAMAEELYARAEADPPADGELLGCGERAITSHVLADWHSRGLAERHSRGHGGLSPKL
ncbi:hypothetical protein [Nonomuraea sp. KM90]|uniref:hypothetical protein n=1 Tax=Nonomuraea sp. KM90 TaxID=3457428 RepID=UPI003FCC6290